MFRSFPTPEPLALRHEHLKNDACVMKCALREIAEHPYSLQEILEIAKGALLVITEPAR